MALNIAESGSDCGASSLWAATAKEMPGSGTHARSLVITSSIEFPGIVRTFSTALASAGMTFPAIPPVIFVAEIPFLITALNTGMRDRRLAPRSELDTSSETRSAIARASSSTGHMRDSSSKNLLVVIVSVTGSR